MAKNRKKRPVKAKEGAPEWMVTFGDLMSLLLTFFVLLFSVSEVKDEKIYDVINSIRMHWQIEAPTAGFTMESVSEVVELLAEQSDNEQQETFDKESRASESIENPWGKNAAVALIDDSLHIEIKGRVAFNESSAELLPEARAVLYEIQRELRGHSNRIRIVGHASPIPLPATSSFDDHDDLAYRRARAVGAVLVSGDEEERPVDVRRIEYSSRGARDMLPGTNVFETDERERLSRVEIIVTPENALKGYKRTQ